jgi:hypothetical protein
MILELGRVSVETKGVPPGNTPELFEGQIRLYTPV